MAETADKPTTRKRAAKSTTRKSAVPKPADRIDLAALDREALLRLDKDVTKALKSYEKRKRDEALREMQRVAEKHGVALKDVMQGGSKKSVQVPKYRHPENPALTWTGRGRQPKWFKEAVAGGKSRNDLAIA